jgi:hypothetical protein
VWHKYNDENGDLGDELPPDLRDELQAELRLEDVRELRRLCVMGWLIVSVLFVLAIGMWALVTYLDSGPH